MYVCVCNKVTDKDIRQAVAAGASSMRALRNTLNVGSNCGSCAEMTRDILNDTLKAQLEQNPDLYYAA